MRYEKFYNKKYEILHCQGYGYYIKDKLNNKYYFLKNINNNYKRKLKKEYIKINHIDIIYSILILLSIISFIYLFFIKYDKIYLDNYNNSNNIYLSSILYLFINVILHELSHYLAMILYNRKPGKIKIKRYHIFLLVVTDTTDSYILPFYRRFVVYYAGIMINLLVYSATIILYPRYAYLLRFVLWGVLYNIIPFGGLETDGYHIFVNVFLKINEQKDGVNLKTLIFKYFFLIFSIIAFLNSLFSLLTDESLFNYLYCVLLNLYI